MRRNEIAAFALVLALALPGLAVAQDTGSAEKDAKAAEEDAKAEAAQASEEESAPDLEAIRLDRQVKAVKYPVAARISRYLAAAAKLSDEGTPEEAHDLLEQSERDARKKAGDDPELKRQAEEMAKLRKTFAAEARAQAAAKRELARKSKAVPGSVGMGTGTSPTPMPSAGQAGLDIKESHARAVEMMQPHG